MDATAFVDTNTLLHYQPVDQIDWCGLLSADRVVIVIAQVILRQLNRIKDAPGASRRKRDRAARVLHQFDEFIETRPDACLRPGVCLLLDDRDPSIDFGEYSLNRELDDDWLLASIIDYRLRVPQCAPGLVTSDIGLKLKARRLDITLHRLPDDLRLPEQPDPEEVRRQELERENRLLKQRLPQLELRFVNGSKHGSFAFSRPAKILREPVLTDIRARYPKMSVPPPRNLIPVAIPGTISQSEIIKYNDELDRFYSAWEDHLDALDTHRESILLEFALQVSNQGTAPAETTRISLDFPQGTQAYNSETVPKPPAEPEPPVRPLSCEQALFSGAGARYRNSLAVNSGLLDALARLSPAPNISSPQVADPAGRTVRFDIQSLLHGVTEKLPAIYVAIGSFDEARSFHVKYQIIAANLPQPREENLHVQIVKET